MWGFTEYVVQTNFLYKFAADQHYNNPAQGPYYNTFLISLN